MKLCECGCGKEIKKEGKRFVRGHYWRGRKQSEEHIRKIAEKNRGKKRSLETRKRQSESMKGKNRGKKRSLETRKNLSEGHKGKKHSLEHRKNMSISANNRIDPRYISGYFYSKKMQKDIFYQSSLELSALEMFEKDENI